MAKSSAAEKRKRIMLAALGGLLVIIVVYQFMTGVDKPSSSKKSQNSNSAAPTASTPTTTAPPSGQLKPTAGPAPSPKSSDEQEQLIALLVQDMTPLDLNAVMKGPRTGTKPDAAANEKRESPFTEPGKRGSIFAEWQAPPLPPPKQPDPPPITIGGAQPSSAVAGTPRTFTLTIRGSKIPADAQILFDGRPKPTTRVNESELTTKMEPGDYAFPRTINIDVKSQSDPVKNYSNPVQFVVQAAPVPQFRYLGYVGGQASLESFADKKIRLYSRGSEIEGWRIDSISDKVVEVTHKTYEIKQQITLQPKPMQ